MAYTLGQASKACGRSKTAIAQALTEGRLSGTKNEQGRWQIDPAELYRVYPAKNVNVDDQGHLPDTPDTNRTGAENERLKATVEGLERLCRQLEDERDNLREQVSAANDERRTTLRQLTALLTDQRTRTTDVIAMPPPEPAAAPSSTAPANAAPAAVKVRPVKKPPVKEAGWFRRMMGGK
jgi:hypothetical protein